MDIIDEKGTGKNMELCIKNKENLEFIFQGSNDINIEELSTFLHKTADIFKVIVTLNEKEIPLQLTVNALEKGSFRIVISAIINFTPKLFTKIKDVKEVVEAFREVIEVKNMLGEKKPKEILENKIISEDNKEYITHNSLVLNIYGNNNNINIIDDALTKFNDTIPKNRNLKIVNKKGSFEINDKVKENLSKKFEFDDENTLEKKEIIEKRILMIKKPDLTMKSQWEFIADKVIKANILDEEFKEKVLKQEFSAYNKMELTVELKTIIKYNENYELVETHYEILKVYY